MPIGIYLQESNLTSYSNQKFQIWLVLKLLYPLGKHAETRGKAAAKPAKKTRGKTTAKPATTPRGKAAAKHGKTLRRREKKINETPEEPECSVRAAIMPTAKPTVHTPTASLLLSKSGQAGFLIFSSDLANKGAGAAGVGKRVFFK